MAVVKIRNLVKRFGKVVAVNDVSFDVADGEFFAMLGPSGCGKTTTLRCIAGLETPESGDILIDDVRVNETEPKDRDIAMVFQFYAMYPKMNVFNQIAFPLVARKVPKDEIASRVKEIAERLGITPILGEPVERLTVDQKQRIALARAIVRNPKVYLLDEPLTNLDAGLRIQMRAELKHLQNSMGTTTIFVTHDQLEAIALASKVLVMRDGHIMQVDAPESLYEKPKNLFVAGFVGSPSMNFIDCNYSEKNGTANIEAGEFMYDVTELKPYLGGLGGSHLMMGVRPEYVHLGRNKPAGPAFKGRVEVLEPLGDRLIVSLSIGKVSLKANIRPTDMELGETVWLSFDTKKILLFDKPAGKALL